MAINRNPNAFAHENGLTESYIIWNPQSQLPPTQTFGTPEEAWEVADRMAVQHDGQKFFVMKAIGFSEVTKPVVRREIPPKMEVGKLGSKVVAARRK